MSERNFLGVWLPREIYLDKNLSWTEKILYVEIQSLDNENGCFASNEYFAEFLDVSTTTISIAISKLRKLNYVECVSFDGRKRVLKSAFKKTEKLVLGKAKGRLKENLKHNNTNNNTPKNNLIKGSEIKFRENKFGQQVTWVSSEIQMSVETANEFLSYWTEKNRSGNKMKFELEKTFDIKRRLLRWQKNSKKWSTSNNKKSINSSADNYMKARQKLMGQ